MAFRTELLLARAFFTRFFENELMPPGLPQAQLVIWGVALLAAPGYMLSLRLAIKYSSIPPAARANLIDSMLLDRLLFVTCGMTALGVVALIVWDGVFPDRRDARILGVLPLRTRTHVMGRLAALAAVAALFCIGVNVPSALVYGPTLWSLNAATGPVRAVAGHLTASAMGGLFVFFLLIAAQGVLLNLFGRRAAERLVLLLQATFMVVLLQALLFVPRLGPRIQAAFEDEPHSLVALLPPAWFLALYDVLAGTPTPVPASYAAAAVGATIAAVVVATVLLAGSYRRLVRMALETLDAGARGRARVLVRACSAIANIVVAHPVQRAVAGFTLRTAARSRAHLVLLATYIGIAAALALAALVPMIARRGIAALDTPGAALLSAPLIFNFITLCGMRVLFGIPTEIKANWAFRLHAPEKHMVEAIAGVRVVLMFLVVLPISSAAGIVGVTLWGPRTGAIHGLFTGALGILLVDALLIGLRKVPFACTYCPGGSRARILWPLYVVAFGVYAYSLARFEAMVLNRPLLLGPLLVVTTLLTTALGYLRRRDLQPPPGFSYEEDSDALFGGFKLSEGLAAESPARTRTHPVGSAR